MFRQTIAKYFSLVSDGKRFFLNVTDHFDSDGRNSVFQRLTRENVSQIPATSIFQALC